MAIYLCICGLLLMISFFTFQRVYHQTLFWDSTVQAKAAMLNLVKTSKKLFYNRIVQDSAERPPKQILRT